jgi:hypothetical protein
VNINTLYLACCVIGFDPRTVQTFVCMYICLYWVWVFLWLCIYKEIYARSRVVCRTHQKNSTSPFLPSMSTVEKAAKGLTALTPEMDCDWQTAMGLPTVTFAVFFVVSDFGKMWAPWRRNIWYVSASPSGIKREWYVSIIGYVESITQAFQVFILG